MIYDLHTHSNNSFDSNVPIIDMCTNAVKKHITHIAFTEHFSIDSNKKTYGHINFEKYFQDITNAKELFHDKLTIYTGIEICEPHEKPHELKKEISNLNLDLILGSVHNINNKGHRLLCNTYDKKTVYDMYFKEVYNLASIGDFDIVAHLDLMNRYAFQPLGNYSFNDYKDVLTLIIKKLISRNIGIEINTSGLKKSLNDIHPKIEVLRLYKDLGGEIITIGSDAHKPSNVGNNCRSSLDLIKNLNYKYIFTFENRVPIAHKI